MKQAQPHRISLIGLSVSPFCLSLYNLRQYAAQDPELQECLVITVHDLDLGQADEDVLAILREARPEVVGLSCYLWSTATLLRIAERLCQELPGTLVLLGGPDAGPRAAGLLQRHRFITGVVEGDGEEVFRLFLRRFVGLDPGGVYTTPGLAWAQTDEVIRNPPAPDVELDRVPPAHRDPDFARRYPGILCIESGRGCRYRCAYCYYAVTPVRFRTLPALLGILDDFAANDGSRIFFFDSAINQNHSLFRGVLEHLQLHPQISLGAMEMNAEDLMLEDIPLMRGKVDSPLGIGLQTTNPVALRTISRRYREPIFRSRVACLRENRIPFRIDLIVGLPGDNIAGFRQSLDDAYSFRPTVVIAGPLEVLPGTVLERKSVQFGLQHEGGPSYKTTGCHSFPLAELRQAERLIAANDVMHGMSLRSDAFQLTAHDLERSPVGLLDDFLNGTWRGEPVSPEELDRWRTPMAWADAHDAMKRFVVACFVAAGRDPPRALLDVLAFQRALARLSWQQPPGSTEDDTQAAVTHTPAFDGAQNVNASTRPRLSPLVELVDVFTDLPRLLADWPPLALAADEPRTVLVGGEDAGYPLILLESDMAFLLRHCDGRHTVDWIADQLPGKSGQKGTTSQRRELLESVERLRENGVVSC